MTGFENFLITKGYIKHLGELHNNNTPKSGKYVTKYKEVTTYSISSLGNMSYRYIHKSDTLLLNKIKEGKGFVFNKDSEMEFKDTILFGLNEHGRPTTLISPRPKIQVIRERVFSNGRKMNVLETEVADNSMNVVLSKEDPEKIFEAMYDHSIVFKYDFLNKKNIR